jgi:hypothetical protein
MFKYRVVCRFYVSIGMTVSLVVVAVSATGCGNSHLPPTVPVRGKVTFSGGPCPESGNIRFTPLEVAEGLPSRPGRADFSANGEYSARSYQPNDGLVPGKYRVFLECWKVPPADGKPGVSYIPSTYQPPELVVNRQSNSVTFDLEVLKESR